MDDEFALCWNNFQDNIASGFQNLYDRGDLVDVTLACDGRLLHAHKIVLAICSPYFQEIFISNPCKHPIIILKDVTHGVMCELLQFMYQGVVNVKHTELQAFMKIAQLLQIKGLASNVAVPLKSPSQLQNISSTAAVQNTSNSSAGTSNITNQSHKQTSGSNQNENNNVNDTKNNVPAPSSSSSTSSPSPMPFSHIKSAPENINPFQTGPGLKRLPEYSTESLSIYSRKQYRRNTESSEQDLCPDSIDHVNTEDNFLATTIPHISIADRFDPNNVKRENNDHTSSPLGLRNSLPPHFGFDYNIYKNNPEYTSDLHLPNDYSKNFGNHMDIPPSGGNVTMLSSTSLLHANCVFNRNNTVATQQGMKTYWLCKSYRISMCRARCITHQGRVISATGVHNHAPHMRNVAGGLEMMPPQQNNSSLIVSNSNANLMQIPTSNANLNNSIPNIRLPPSATNLSQHNISAINHQQQQQQQSPQPTPPHHHHLPHGISSNPPQHQMHQNATSHHYHQTQHLSSHNQSSVIQNMMHNVNLMHLSNMAPMLNTLPTQHSPQMNSIQHQTHHHQHSHHQIPQPPSSLEITPILTESPCVNSPSNRRSDPSQIDNIDSPMHSSAGPSGSSAVALESPSQGSDGNGSSHVPDATASLVPNSAVSPDGISSNCQDNSSQHSHIISSITISPGSAHNFKIENM